MDVATFLLVVRTYWLKYTYKLEPIDFVYQYDTCLIKSLFEGEEHAHTEYQVLVIDKMRLKHWTKNKTSEVVFNV